MKSLQGTSLDRLTGRPAGRPRKTALLAPYGATPTLAKESELAEAAAPHFIRGLRAADTEDEPSSQDRSPAPAPSSPVEPTDQSGKHDVRRMSQRKQSKCNTSSGVKRVARAAELLN